ncbi:hypothetical protein ACMU_15950 [Actibacterium mucosum KCTC 23349]|uniref:Gluconokinase n=2 Tax=Actibacterium TaxID=1433986 RepID=A0A037ZIF3_9RHOB|nr:hypothetical protein ACMU_15950 [Actibacterium mucosum KCTC 23349]
MGVSGCGKSSVGAAVAARIGASFIDGDDLHPQSNIDKMASGQPLNDHDRAPWLVKVGATLKQADETTIIGCSSLKRAYRHIIRTTAAGPVQFLFLDGSREVLLGRMTSRPGHFMPASLLDSQLATLERPGADENAHIFDIDQPFNTLVDTVVTRIQEEPK